MKQYRITTQNLSQKSDEDCYLAPDDPVHALIAASVMDGLGSQEKLQEYQSLNTPKINPSDKGQIQKELGIKPGTEEWFKLWFSQNK